MKTSEQYCSMLMCSIKEQHNSVHSHNEALYVVVGSKKHKMYDTQTQRPSILINADFRAVHTVVHLMLYTVQLTRSPSAPELMLNNFLLIDSSGLRKCKLLHAKIVKHMRGRLAEYVMSYGFFCYSIVRQNLYRQNLRALKRKLIQIPGLTI